MRRSPVSRFLLVFTLLLVTVAHLSAQASVIYVDSTATGADDGTSWFDAYADLQSALGTAASWDSIWVAAGTYRPSSAGNRDSTFQLVDTVAVYGGFAGVETSVLERDWVANVTILSGDIGVVGVDTDNSYHVVTGSGTNSTAVLDGFTITKGNADHPSSGDARTQGGGMYNAGGSPTIVNVTFSENAAVSNGGAMFNDGSSPTLTDVAFKGNFSNWYGGGIYNRTGSNPTLTNVAFSNNTADRGGGIYNTTSSPTLVNVVFAGNAATNNQGGAMYNYVGSNSALTNVTFSNNTAPYGGGIFNNMSSPTLVNTIMWGNSATGGGNEMFNHSSAPVVSYSLIQGGLPGGCVNGGNNVYDNPLFVDGPGGDLHLSGPASAAFDSGNNAAPDILATDLDGNDRIMNGTVDMGAYELQAEGAIVVASPWSVVFGMVLCGETACDTIHVVNVGEDTCTVAEIYGCTALPFSTDTSMTAGTLAPGDATAIVVCVTPTVGGSDTCAVTIVSDAWNSPVTVQVWVDATTGIATPKPFLIVSITPNPFNPTMTVHFTLPAALPVTAAVYSVTGGRVRVLANEDWFDPGDNRLIWDGRTDKGSPAASGVYFIRIETPLGARVARAVLLK